MEPSTIADAILVVEGLVYDDDDDDDDVLSGQNGVIQPLESPKECLCQKIKLNR